MMMENLMPEFGNKTFDGGIVSPISRYHDITLLAAGYWLLAAGLLHFLLLVRPGARERIHNAPNP